MDIGKLKSTVYAPTFVEIGHSSTAGRTAAKNQGEEYIFSAVPWQIAIPEEVKVEAKPQPVPEQKVEQKPEEPVYYEEEYEQPQRNNRYRGKPKYVRTKYVYVPKKKPSESAEFSGQQS